MPRNGPLLLFLWVLAEQLGAPIPAFPALLAAGAISRTSGEWLWLPLTIAVTASLLADVLWYAIGRRRGAGIMRFICRISLEPDSCVRRTEDVFERRGAATLLVAKFVPGLSTVAPPLAGIVRMPFSRFLLFNTAGAVLWAGTSLLAGFVFSRQLEAILTAVSRAGDWLQLTIIVLAVYLAFKWWSRQRFLRSIRVGRIRPEELKEMLDAGEEIVVVDLRSSREFEESPQSIPGAMRIAADDLVRDHGKIPRDRDVILFCT
ncbi:MAG TPA: VTT domain-containing protein [Candidatus Polarisedimenticolaceae bacterium]|nr:VTT domain-containing protein [Candidatus Polarisedimenticolaceae bacterium]